MSNDALIDASMLDDDLALAADVVIVGSGAGGGIAAEVLSGAGLSVIIVEEGGYFAAPDFELTERQAYADLYADMAGRKTSDKAITILQGRCVGGGTTVNWTASFRTPSETLRHWQDVHGLPGLGEEQLTPWFERVEERLNIIPWQAYPPNANNAVLQRGAAAIGVQSGIISRNVRSCINLGLCGLGCPVNAKQSTLVTAIPEAVSKGAKLLTHARVERLNWTGEQVQGVSAVALDGDGLQATGRRIEIAGRHIVMAAGGIGSPAVLLRSQIPDPSGLLGRRTFLHPTVGAVGVMKEEIEGFAGAPQSIYCDHFLWQDGPTGRLGFKVEAAPVYPALAAAVSRLHGWDLAGRMAALSRSSVLIGLLRDGFHPESQGGRVQLTGDGAPVLDYPWNSLLKDGMRRAYGTMLELLFAAGAESASPLHMDAPAKGYDSLEVARAGLLDLRMEELRAGLFSAHVMGGCAMGSQPGNSVVTEAGRHHAFRNLWVMDGSVFPTSIGANPQVSIMALAMRNAHALAELETRGTGENR